MAANDRLALDPLPTHATRVHRASPTILEMYIDFADMPADIAVRGRVTGPRWPGVSTVEVAYPLRPRAESSSAFTVLIPEPSFWSTERPCDYLVRVEFVRGGTIAGTQVFTFGVASPAN
jgi:hypothetical protein